MACKDTCRMEFRCKSFSLGGTKPNLFATPQGRWLGMPWTFITYRVAIFLYQLTFVILTLVYWGKEPLYSPADTKAKWLIYISNWTYLFVLTYFLISMITAIYWNLGPGKRGDVGQSSGESAEKIEMGTMNPVADAEAMPIYDQEHSTPWYFQIQRFCQVYSCSASVFVTLLFWILEYNPDTSLVHVFNVHVHGVAMILMIIDTLLVATPFRILHMVYVSLVAFIYFCFTAIYHAAGGLNPAGETHIYSGNLDWGKAASRSAIIAALTVLVAAPILHMIFYGLYRMRRAFGNCCTCCSHHDS